MEVATKKANVQIETNQQECPQCHSTIPVYPGYVTWCDHCGWNLQPYEPERPKNIFESFYSSMGAKFSKKLFADMTKEGNDKPHWTVSKVLAFMVAGLVHAFTLGMAALGLFLFLKAWSRGWSFIIIMVIGLVCIAAAWAIRPRVPKLRKDAKIMPRDKFPTLYKLTDQISEMLGISPVSAIIIEDHFNAAFTQIGWRRKKVMYIGLPLFSVLNGQEKVALLGHEIAHGVNKDPARSFFVWTAIGSLNVWYYLLRPREIWGDSNGLGVLAIPGNLLLLVLSSIPRFWLYVLIHLFWRDSQRAEYLADGLAASVSGTDAMLSMLEKLHLGGMFEFTLRKIGLNDHKRNLFSALQYQVAHVPRRELERIRRVEQMENSRLDTTHPPTAYRIDFLRAHSTTMPKVVLTNAELDLLNVELASVEPEIQQDILEKHSRSLYY